MNPDLAAQQFIKDLLLDPDFVMEFPDGATMRFAQVDVGFSAIPVNALYASIHSTTARATVKRLGQGSGMQARSFEVDLLLSVEYEDPTPKRGNERLTQIRWEVTKLLATNANKFPDFQIAEIGESSLYAFNSATGDFQDWGYIGQILFPITVSMPYFTETK